MTYERPQNTAFYLLAGVIWGVYRDFVGSGNGKASTHAKSKKEEVFMKAEINIDVEELAGAIAQAIVKAIKPMLSNTETEKDAIFTTDTIAKYLGVSKQWVYKRVQFKEIPYSKMGNFLRFKKSAIDTWLDTNKVPVIG